MTVVPMYLVAYSVFSVSSYTLSRSASLLLPRHPGASADPLLLLQWERTPSKSSEIAVMVGF
jgi:hypothetical protein